VHVDEAAVLVFDDLAEGDPQGVAELAAADAQLAGEGPGQGTGCLVPQGRDGGVEQDGGVVVEAVRA
jgi:hypothetical protein